MKHAHDPRHCTARDFLTITGTDQPEIADFERAADEYLKIFVAPVMVDEKMVCFHCGSPLDSFKQMLGIGAAIEWGLVHGEGRCSGMPHHDKPCGWPYRGMHYAKAGGAPFTLSNFFLAYHPDAVSCPGHQASDDDATICRHCGASSFEEAPEPAEAP